MGGRSEGGLQLTEEGNARFPGSVSLENNGGFSSVRYGLDELETSGHTKFIIRLKGDGKSIEIPFAEMYPSFRGRTLDMPNFWIE